MATIVHDQYVPTDAPLSGKYGWQCAIKGERNYMAVKKTGEFASPIHANLLPPPASHSPRYVVVTSLHPMTVSIYRDGIVRFATSK